MKRAISRILTSLFFVIGINQAAQANDGVLLQNAYSQDSGQAWFDYLSQCSDCNARHEALGQLQLKQYLANGGLEIEGAAAGAASAVDTTLLEKARSSNAAQDWYNYLSQCGSCEARGEALGAMQSLQMAANGNLALDATSLSGQAQATALSQNDIEPLAGDETSLGDNAYSQGTAIAWYSYLVGCQRCEDRRTALNALQALQYGSNGDAFNSNISWVPGETLPTSETDNTELAAEEASTEGEDELTAEETAVEQPAEEPAPEELLAGGDIQFNEPEDSNNTDIAAEESFAETSDGMSDEIGDSWELALEISGHSRAVWRVAFSPVAPLLASASGDRTVLLYDLNARDIKHRLTAHSGYVNAIAFSPDGKLIASGSGDQSIIIWDVASGQALRTLRGHAGDINALAWSASGDLLVSGADDGRVLAWNSQSGKRIAEMSETGNDVTAIAIAPNEETIVAAGSNGFIYLFDTQSGAQKDQLQTNKGYTFDLAWSTDGQRLTAAGSDGNIRQWQLSSGNANVVSQSKRAITGIDFSANGNYVTSSSFNGNVTVYDANSFTALQTIAAYPGSAYSVSMTGDGRYLAAAGGVSFIRVWRR